MNELNGNCGIENSSDTGFSPEENNINALKVHTEYMKRKLAKEQRRGPDKLSRGKVGYFVRAINALEWATTVLEMQRKENGTGRTN